MKQKILVYLSLLMYALIVVAIVKVKSFEELPTISVINNNVAIDFSVTAESCIVIDAKLNAVLYEKNAYKQMLPASITKILTAITSIENYPLDDYVHINNEIANQVGSKIYLKNNDLISVSDLLYGLILSSGNDCAMALAMHYSGKEEDFIKLMNDVAQKAGCKNSYFQNASGLDETNENHTTAYDMALITSYALKNVCFREIFSTKNKNITLSDRTLYLHHKHRLIHSSNLITGGKTGYTKKAGRTLVSSFSDGQNEIIVVTLDAYNDWEIHKKFASAYLDESNKFLYSNTKVLLNENTQTLLESFER